MITPARRVFSVLLACAFAAPCAGVVTTLPDKVTTVAGACMQYQSVLAASGATEPSGRTHPGACQYTTFAPTFYGKPWSEYLAEVVSWKSALPSLKYELNARDPNWPYVALGGPRGSAPRPAVRPYTIQGDLGSVTGPFGQVCAQVVGFAPSFSATIQTSRLAWTGAGPAGTPCAREWSRVDPAVALSGRAAAAANDLVQKTATSLTGLVQGRRFCGASRAAVELEIADAIGKLVESAAPGALSRWEGERPSFDGPGPGAANVCNIQCGLCAPGWVGRIVCRKTITGPSGYHHDETQTWVVGGPAQMTGGHTNYPVAWSASGLGGATGKSWTINATLPTDLSLTVLANGISTFDRTGAIVIPGGIVGTPVSFALNEIDFPPIVGSSSTVTSIPGAWSRPTAGGDSPQQLGGSTGTLSCTWLLDRQ